MVYCDSTHNWQLAVTACGSWQQDSSKGARYVCRIMRCGSTRVPVRRVATSGCHIRWLAVLFLSSVTLVFRVQPAFLPIRHADWVVEHVQRGPALGNRHKC